MSSRRSRRGYVGLHDAHRPLAGRFFFARMLTAQPSLPPLSREFRVGAAPHSAFPLAGAMDAR